MTENIKIPTTVEDIMLIQPNNITFGKYSLNPVQENVLTLIIDALQKHITKEKPFDTDLFNQPYVSINCDEAGGRNSKHQVKKAIKDMRTKEFEFKWIPEGTKRNIETSGVVIDTTHDFIGTNEIRININAWSIPFLIYYGIGVGGTRFNKAIALNLPGESTKRIYKMICRWQDKSEFFLGIQQFRKDLELLDIKSTADNKYLKKHILEPAKKRIKESGSDIWFDYKLICKKPIKGRKPKADTIIFYIYNKKPIENNTDLTKAYSYVYAWLNRVWDNVSSSKARDIADKLNEQQNILKVYERFIRIDDDIEEGKTTTESAIGLIKHILKSDYKIR